MNRRLFIAITLPKKTLNQIYKFQTIHTQKEVRWIPKKNLHLTILFLGQVTARKITKIVHKLESLLNKFEPLILKPGQITLYPKKNPRMVWLMFSNNYEAYRHLVDEVARCLKGTVSLKQSRRKIIPHVTLGRIRYKIKSQNKAKLQKKLNWNEEITINQIILFHSELTARGSTYEPLYRFPLERG